MIPVLVTMFALFAVTMCIDLIRREQERVGDGTVASMLAILTILIAVAGTAYVWRLSFEAERQMEQAQRQIESIWP